MTERELLDMLHAKLFREAAGNGGRRPPGVVKDDLPDGWGLMTIKSGHRMVRTAVPQVDWTPDPKGRPHYWRVPYTELVRKVSAPRLQPDPLPRDMLATIMRATAITAERRAS